MAILRLVKTTCYPHVRSNMLFFTFEDMLTRESSPGISLCLYDKAIFQI